MKKIIIIILLCIACNVHAGFEEMIVGGEIDNVFVAETDSGIIMDLEDYDYETDAGYTASGLSCVIISGTVKGKMSGGLTHNVDGGTVRSNLTGASGISNGEYYISDIQGNITLTFNNTDHDQTTASVNASSCGQYRVDVEMKCQDYDHDCVCDQIDNCPSKPNGPCKGTCITVSSSNFKSIVGTVCYQNPSCGCEWCDLNQLTYCTPNETTGTSCSDCMYYPYGCSPDICD